jgi:uncharacterized membrane protein YoaK (UPF0700 family)
MLLAGSAIVSQFGLATTAAVVMAVAMGFSNNVLTRDGEASVGVTYMTGSLVKLGQRIAAACLGGDRFGWVPYLALWLGFVVGVVLGAVAYSRVGLADMWGAALAAALLGVAAARLDI